MFNSEKPTALSDVKILRQLMGWLLVTLLMYTLLRLEFLWWNWTSWYHSPNKREILSALLHGLRYDISSIFWLSSLIFLGALLPWMGVRASLKERALKTTFLVIHIPFLLINIIDSEFIHFSGRRMTPDSFYLIKESDGKLSALFSTYWPLALFSVFLLFIYHFAIQKITDRESQKTLPTLTRFFSNPKKRLFTSLFLLVGFIIGTRGGFQRKPLNIAHATSLYADLRLTHLTLNSSFTTIHSLQKKRLVPLSYFSTSEELHSHLNDSQQGTPLMPWDPPPKNVVLFILESFGLEYTGLDLKDLPVGVTKKSFTPFLDSLKDKSIVFKNSYANGRRSIEALPSLFAGIPSLLDEPFVLSPYQTNEIPRLGIKLKNKGVWTGFFHGGANGTMFFQEFIERIGIEHYFGKNEYPHSGHDDGTWGIWDGPFLQFFQTQLDQIKTPFFASLFTLSSHHPFKVPEEFEKNLPSGPLPILKSIAYTDLMLKEFFEKSRDKKWFKETLFIFTADHTSKSYVTHYQTPEGNFKIPIILYYPQASFTADRQKISLEEPVQQIDLYKTIEDIFKVPPSKSLLGRSVLKDGPRKVALYLDGQQLLINKNEMIIRSVEQENQKSEEKDSPLLLDWKATRQYYINNLLKNSIEPSGAADLTPSDPEPSTLNPH